MNSPVRERAEDKSELPAVTGSLSLDAFYAGTGLGAWRTGIEYKEFFVYYAFARVEGWGIEIDFEDGDDTPRSVEINLAEQARQLARERPAVESPRPKAIALTGSPVADVRSLSGLTTQQLADVVGVTERTLLSWRRTPKQIPNEKRMLLEGLQAIAATLVGGLGPRGVSAWFLTGPDAPVRLVGEGRLDEVRDRALSYVESLAT